jgi:hypothetical protein
MGHGARLEDEVNLRAAFAFKRGYINLLYFLLSKLQLQKSAFLPRSQDVLLCPHPILSQWPLLT